MINPVAFNLGSLQIRWYGILMALSYIIGYFIAVKLASKRNISKKDVEDFFILLIPAAVVGARILHVIDDWSLYKDNLIEIFYIWSGGLAFFGGFILVVIATFYYCKRRKINFYDFADLFVIPLALGLAIGRIGNFINQELYGVRTSLPWGIQFDNIQGKRHPTQLYGTIKDLFIFFILLNNYKNKNLPKGFIFWSFIILYSGIRFFLDFLRDWDTWIIGLTHAQIYALIASLIGIYMLRKLKKKTS